MYNIKLIYQNSSLYPQKLFSIKKPPDLLFALGNTKLLNEFSISVVGARKCSTNSKLLTNSLVKELSLRNIVILSGMAEGIDTIAHETCIENKGKTIAILGNGFNYSSKKNIYKKILENNGLILSEYFPDMPAFKYNFQRRNELIVALTDGVVAVEAHEKGGTLITARHALNQNKPLFTFPGNLDNQNYFGNNLLLTKGAKCITSYKEVIKYYTDLKFKKSKSLKTLIIPNEYLSIYSLLSTTPQSINKLSKNLDVSIQELQYKLTLMELDDLIKKLPNDYYIKI